MNATLKSIKDKTESTMIIRAVDNVQQLLEVAKSHRSMTPLTFEWEKGDSSNIPAVLRNEIKKQISFWGIGAGTVQHQRLEWVAKQVGIELEFYHVSQCFYVAGFWDPTIKVYTVKIYPKDIPYLIGKGGRNIKKVVEELGGIKLNIVPDEKRYCYTEERFTA